MDAAERIDETGAVETADYLASLLKLVDGLDQQIHEAQRELKLRLHALRLAQDPEFRAGAAAAMKEIDGGTARRGAQSIADLDALRAKYA